MSQRPDAAQRIKLTEDLLESAGHIIIPPDEGYAIVNLDISLLAEVPKIRPHHARMRQAIAESFGIHAGLVGLKATTVERLGSIGREEGIACQAVAMIRRIRTAPR